MIKISLIGPIIVLLIAVICGLGSLLYIQAGLVHDQQQEIVELSSKIKSTEQAANLEYQTKCYEQAHKEFALYGWDKKPLTSYSNHYNEKLNKCFMKIEDDSIPGFKTEILSDAFEGATYATYMWQAKKGKKYWEVPPFMCDVKDLAGNKKVCNSSDEFDSLLKVYMD